MMVLAFRQQGDTVHEAPGFGKIAEPEVAGDRLAAFYQRPAWQRLRQCRALRIGQTCRHEQSSCSGSID
jgi:hypothetical protein